MRFGELIIGRAFNFLRGEEGLFHDSFVSHLQKRFEHKKTQTNIID